MSGERVLIDFDGAPYVNQDIQDVAAKKNKENYFVLVSNDGVLFHPSRNADELNKKDSYRGNNFFNLQRCGPLCYNNYVSFLRSKNYAHFLIAQRCFSDGQ